ncbi:MAG TPA: aquaporin [Candidatus Binatia bacterium]|nr:aquaporin [Candidatus Binatia bacterium]
MSLARRLTAEGLGTAGLLAAIVGSGMMGEQLSGGNVALALLANTASTAAALLALILAFGGISGAHFNPVVSWMEMARGELAAPEALAYSTAQILGALAGVACAHAMFGHDAWTLSTTARNGASQVFSELVATFGLVAVIRGCSYSRPAAVPAAVAAYIASAFWFTASTSFANPAVTLARATTDSFSGIRPGDVPPFLAAQVVGGAMAASLFAWLLPRPAASSQVDQGAVSAEVVSTLPSG